MPTSHSRGGLLLPVRVANDVAVGMRGQLSMMFAPVGLSFGVDVFPRDARPALLRGHYSYYGITGNARSNRSFVGTAHAARDPSERASASMRVRSLSVLCLIRSNTLVLTGEKPEKPSVAVFIARRDEAPYIHQS